MHDLDLDARLQRQQAGMEELRAMLRDAAQLAQGQRAEIDLLKGELGSLRGIGDARDGVAERRVGQSEDIPGPSVLPNLVWSRTSTLGVERPGELSRSSAAPQLNSSASGSILSPSMNVGHSTHEMNANL